MTNEHINCKEDIQIVRMMFSGEDTFFERVCFGCGWFDHTKYKSQEAALKAKGG